ncbi:phosphodiesterase I [Malassezia brasiliensis]|uniref:Fanconi-associated nuclease n=1 Tax=Malassezia brasiliensis TaxID=1821822 RepID=A0AAF0DX97_9BASI|nr:phosphodiesterase I [Malassezia brasiliensis]
MPLHLAHHKSYHPYNRENIERVRRDQAEARERERAEEERLADADRQERLHTLRAQRDAREAGDAAAPKHDVQITTREGHINFWQDYELGRTQPADDAPTASDARPAATRRPTVELNPWYANAELRNGREQQKNEDEVLEDCYRDTALKSRHDPLRSIQAHLDEREASSRALPVRAPGSPRTTHTLASERAERESRERHEPSDTHASAHAPIEPTSDELWAELGEIDASLVPEPGDASFSSLDETLLMAAPLEDAETPQEAPVERLVSQRYGRESMYVELVQDMICVVLAHESNLFTERERACLQHIILLPYEARYLFVRLVQRKRTWHRLDRLTYDGEIADVGAACTALCCPFGVPTAPSDSKAPAHGADHELYRFAMMDVEMAGGIEARLATLRLDELKQLAKRLGVARRAKTREALVAELLAKPKNATLLSFGAPGTVRELGMDTHAWRTRLETELARSAPGCICIVPDVARLLDRVGLVYYRGRPAWGSLLTAAVLARTHKWHFPTYRIERTPDLFGSRAQLLAFEHALQLEEAMDEHIDALSTSLDAARHGVTVLDAAWPDWQRAVQDVRNRYPAGDALDPYAYVRMQFHPGWVLTRIVYKGCECLARLGHRHREQRLLCALLSQRYFRRGRRGQWHERLAILAAKPQDGVPVADARRAALARCEAALHDPDTHLIYQFSLQRRIERLEAQLKIPPTARHNFAHHQLCNAHHRIIRGMRLAAPIGRTGTRSLWRSASGASISVEELCLEAYAQRQFRGVHCEGSIVLFLFTLLMWDILFAPVDGAFETAYQREPLDLPTDVFAVARRAAIDARLAEIEATGGVDLVRAVDARERPQRTAAVACRWDDFSAEDLAEIAECIGGRALALLCRLLCEEWAMRTSGFPDLCLWRYSDRTVCFAEVKGPNDRLSEKQKVWIDVLIRAGLTVELARVKDLETHSPSKRQRCKDV